MKRSRTWAHRGRGFRNASKSGMRDLQSVHNSGEVDAWQSSQMNRPHLEHVATEGDSGWDGQLAGGAATVGGAALIGKARPGSRPSLRPQPKTKGRTKTKSECAADRR